MKNINLLTFCNSSGISISTIFRRKFLTPFPWPPLGDHLTTRLPGQTCSPPDPRTLSTYGLCTTLPWHPSLSLVPNANISDPSKILFSRAPLAPQVTETFHSRDLDPLSYPFSPPLAMYHYHLGLLIFAGLLGISSIPRAHAYRGPMEIPRHCSGSERLLNEQRCILRSNC